ncbi:MAG: hypothetical protein HY905_14905 [Deltaproteobacteria bacterium]|nr:hypothetical protein [Deltaproteobacteria bacterium]
MRYTLGIVAWWLAAAACSSGSGAPDAVVGDATDGMDTTGETDGDATPPDVAGDADGDASAPDGDADAGGDAIPETDADASDDGGGFPPSTFELVSRATEDCTLGALGCAGWPGPEDGPVYLFTSRETRDGASWERTFHVHVPAGAPGPLPLVVMLHGGTLSGDRTLGTANLDDIGDDRGAAGISWRPNTGDCRAEPTTGLLPSYVDGGGTRCTPPAAIYRNGQAFVSAFPDGVLDDGSSTQRHWEDGRIPSPGFDTPGQHRDDVGFIDHVLAVLLDDDVVDVDPGALYVLGGSNGGMMTQRVVCNAGNPAYPRLGRVAAFCAMVSTLPEGLYDGLEGRPTCPRTAGSDFGLLLMLGTDIDTPDCEAYPCDAPVVSGDGLIPYGEAGGRYHVNSPDNGRVISGPDTIELWRTALAYRAGEAGTTTTEPLGWFTTRHVTTFAGSAASFEAWVTTGGGHMLGSTREDFAPNPRAWWFLSSFRRDATGRLTRDEPTWMTGTF